MARRRGLSRTLIRIWVDKYEAGAFDEGAEAANTIQEYKARIAPLERVVGKQALDLEFLTGRSGKDGDRVLAAQSRQNDPDLLLRPTFLRVARRMSRTCFLAVSRGPEFRLIFAPSEAVMSQNSAVNQIPQPVS